MSIKLKFLMMAILLLSSGVGPLAAERVTRGEFEVEFRRFSQRFTMTVIALSTEIRAQPITGEQRNQIAGLQLQSITSAVNIAIGENPVTNLLDMMVLTSTFQRRVEKGIRLEDQRLTTRLIESVGQLKADAWKLSDYVLSTEQQDELRRLIDESTPENPSQDYLWPVRFSSLSGVSGTDLEMTQESGGQLKQFSPAFGVVRDTRDLGERLLFYLQFVPYVTSLQVEKIALGLVSAPEIGESVAEVSELLPTLEAARGLAKEINETTKTLERTATSINLDLGGTAGGPVDLEAFTKLLEKSATAMVEARYTIEALERLAVSQPADQPFPLVIDGFKEAIDDIVTRVFILAMLTIIIFFIALFFYHRAMRSIANPKNPSIG